jgi:archaellum component FlaC
VLINIKDDMSNSAKNSSFDSRKEEVSLYAAKSYDQPLRKLEEEAREHIRIEQQLKLYIDSMEEQTEESETIISQLKASLKVKSEEINTLKENLRKSEKKCKELKQKVEKLERTGSPLVETLEHSHTQLTISAEKKPLKAIEVAKSRRITNGSKKVRNRSPLG